MSDKHSSLHTETVGDFGMHEAMEETGIQE